MSISRVQRGGKLLADGDKPVVKVKLKLTVNKLTFIVKEGIHCIIV